MFTIALNFEDGITRFIQCNAGEKCWTPPTDRRSTCRWIARTASAGPANAIAPAATYGMGKVSGGGVERRG